MRVNTPSLFQALSRAIVAALEEAEPRGVGAVLQTVRLMRDVYREDPDLLQTVQRTRDLYRAALVPTASPPPNDVPTAAHPPNDVRARAAQSS